MTVKAAVDHRDGVWRLQGKGEVPRHGDV